MQEKLVFNRVKGLKFLYDNFPYLYDASRIQLFFVESKQALYDLEIDNNSFDTIVLKRSSNKGFISDFKFKDNRFFNSLQEMKVGANEFEDMFDFCVECHKFKEGENYYSDKLAIAQFSTRNNCDCCDRINFIPSIVPGVNTRDNFPYLELEYDYNYGNIYRVNKTNMELLIMNGLNDYVISYLAEKLHLLIDTIRNRLVELSYYNDFQLIIRIDSYLNLLPIDFRTANAWINKK